MVEIKNFRVIALIIGALVMTAAMAVGPVDAQQKGGGKGWYECLSGSNEHVFAGDVDKEDVHLSGIVFMLCRDMMSTDGNGNFRPNEPVSRAGAAHATLRVYEHRTELTNNHCKHSGSWPKPFTDVDSRTTPHGPEIIEAWCVGIWNGVNADQFQPLGSLTRAQVASVVVRMLDKTWDELYGFDWSWYNSCSNSNQFTDVNVNSVHSQQINLLACNHLVRGKGEGQYIPQAKLTRGQLASILSVARGQHVDTKEDFGVK